MVEAEASSSPSGDKDDSPPFWPSVRRLMLILVACWPTIIAFSIVASLRYLANQLENVYGGKIVDALANKDYDDFLLQTGLLALSYVLYSVLLIAEVYFRTRSRARLSQYLKMKLYSTLMLEKTQTFFDQSLSSDLGTRLSSDADDLTSLLGPWVPNVVAQVGELIFCVVFLFSTNAKLTFVLACNIPVVALVTWLQTKFETPLDDQYTEMVSQTNSRAVETLAQIKTVSIFGQQRRERRALAQFLARLDMLNIKLSATRSIASAMVALVFNMTIAFSFWFGGRLVLDGEITAGQYLAFSMVSLTVSSAVSYFPELISELSQMRATATRIFEVLEETPLAPHNSTNKRKHSRSRITPPASHIVEGNIKFEKVSFTYPTRPENPVLKEFNLEIKPGCSAALVGSSGGGKSTIVAILMRLYEEYTGRITIDGFDLAELHPAWLRRQIGFVSQEPVLFSTTVRENICYGLLDEDEEEDTLLGDDADALMKRAYEDIRLEDLNKASSATTTGSSASNPSEKKFGISRKTGGDISQERLEEVAKMANAHDFIMALPDGYDTLVGERGSMLSGGQKQRIAIARALLRNPKILITDEATSALDNDSERIVQQALDRLMEGRTCIVVAHRLSTVRRCNPICYLAGGKVLESGDHEHLMSLPNGHYRKLHTYEEQKAHLTEEENTFREQELRESQEVTLIVPPSEDPVNPLESDHKARERIASTTADA